jgi:hypothetical protein
VAQGAAPKLSEAPVPAQGNGKAVSHIAHGVCSNRKQGWRLPAYRSRQEVDGADKMQHVGSSFIGTCTRSDGMARCSA